MPPSSSSRNSPRRKRCGCPRLFPPLACGVPVIYAGLGETAAILQAEACGVAVEPESPRALAQAIRDLAERPERRREMGLRARRLAERDFSWTILAADWVRQMACIQAGRDPGVPGLANPARSSQS